MNETTVREKWKDIPGYEGLYQASTQGRIRSKAGKVTSSARFERRVWKQRVLKQKVQTKRYGRKDARVHLWKDGKEKMLLVSRLVAMTWCAGFSEDKTVNHIDGNSMNNTAENLEWLPIRENIQEGFKTALFKNIQIPVVVVENGEIKLFPSMAKASIALGKNPGYLSNKYQRMQKAKVRK